MVVSHLNAILYKVAEAETHGQRWRGRTRASILSVQRGEREGVREEATSRLLRARDDDDDDGDEREAARDLYRLVFQIRCVPSVKFVAVRMS